MADGSADIENMKANESSMQDLWSDDYPQEQMLGVLLGRVLTAGQIDHDQTARLCLTVRELAGLLPADQQMERSLATAEGLEAFLEDDGRARKLGGAIRDWRVTIELVRSRFGWLELPPAVRERAHQRAKALVDEGQLRGWLLERHGQWLLTEQGEDEAKKWQAS